MSELNDLNEKIKAITERSEKEINKLKRAYAVKHRRFCIGDILQERSAVILVDIILWSSCSSGGAPFSVYYGYVLTKKLKPRKDGERRRLYGKEVIKLENKGE